jgi:hypothetical protein
MNLFVTKTKTLMVLILIIMAGLPTLSATSITETTIATIPLYRFGPQGDITSLEVEISVEDGECVSDAIAETCDDLASNDAEIQHFLKNLGKNLSFMAAITSRGKGILFDMKIRIPFIRQNKIYPDQPPYFFWLRIPIVYANYRNDPKAETIIKPYGKNATILTGNHSVLAVKFVGYTGWWGCVSWRGFVIRSGFAWFALLTKTTIR